MVIDRLENIEKYTLLHPLDISMRKERNPTIVAITCIWNRETACWPVEVIVLPRPC